MHLPARVNKLHDAVVNNQLKVNVLAAAGGGAWLAFSILSSDKALRSRR